MVVNNSNKNAGSWWLYSPTDWCFLNGEQTMVKLLLTGFNAIGFWLIGSLWIVGVMGSSWFIGSWAAVNNRSFRGRVNSPEIRTERVCCVFAAVQRWFSVAKLRHKAATFEAMYIVVDPSVHKPPLVYHSLSINGWLSPRFWGFSFTALHHYGPPVATGFTSPNWWGSTFFSELEAAWNGSSKLGVKQIDAWRPRRSEGSFSSCRCWMCNLSRGSTEKQHQTHLADE